MTSPFDWKGQPPKIDLRDIAKAQKNAHQQTAVVNRKRAAGIEPNTIHMPGSHQDVPQKFAVKLPDMPLHERSKRKRRAKEDNCD